MMTTVATDSPTTVAFPVLVLLLILLVFPDSGPVWCVCRCSWSSLRLPGCLRWRRAGCFGSAKGEESAVRSHLLALGTAR